MTRQLLDLAASTAVADGAWSTQLRLRGLSGEIPAEAANIAQGHLVALLAREYLQAGAMILSTNTFAANAFNFARRGWKWDVLEINRSGATIARNVAGDKALVAGVIGPSGALLAIREGPEDQLRSGFAAQARALAESGADAILLETFSDPREILLALGAVRDATKLPVIASLSFDSGPQHLQTMMGAGAEECARLLDQAGADIVGCNCGAGIAQALPTVLAMRAATSKPLWVKPSAGVPDIVDGALVYSQTLDEYGGFIPALLDAGANFIGGCCGTGPEHVKRIAALLQSRRRRKA